MAIRIVIIIFVQLTEQIWILDRSRHIFDPVLGLYLACHKHKWVNARLLFGRET